MFANRASETPPSVATRFDVSASWIIAFVTSRRASS